MLRLVLSLNFLSCLVFGSLFVLNSAQVIKFLSFSAAPIVIQGAGAILLLFAAHLLTAILRKNFIKWEILYFSFGDALWVLGSVLILLFSSWIGSYQGIIATIAVALLVAAFATGQFLLLRSQTKLS
ncbi:hypothetical protein [Pseudobacteriovorax antillogorgiicola]|uniref:Uncharacterized protein n=1 Tax=Pseudobacteriovorax antillogorgiicola TaxID=1513793 RepID=A0A1Y6CJ68_9BACT|nr:hypothetical protein [Pseudobacteriovorax antillogorgiicola]TCS47977.1 hypothetical protein EDD56_11988 [Pseudobacteriovorax antillogorgiicola]SMF58250.1 hypothetical protein SAMN06296036_11989 [Pseudobacteriovorax antillogorgiicola]